MHILPAVSLLLAISLSEAKNFTKCELVEALERFVVDGNVAEWVCMAQAESRLKSHVVGPRNDDQSYDYGIFQINSHYWCKNNIPTTHGISHNQCNISCSGKLIKNTRGRSGCVVSCMHDR
jgi:hypothetical protein